MKNNKYSRAVKLLSKKLVDFQVLLKTSRDELTSGKRSSKEETFEKLLNPIIAIMKLIKIIEKRERIILIDQDYINFCLLRFHGNNMSRFLLEQETDSKQTLWHADSWDKLMSEQFIPFLKENFYANTKNNLDKGS